MSAWREPANDRTREIHHEQLERRLERDAVPGGVKRSHTKTARSFPQPVALASLEAGSERNGERVAIETAGTEAVLARRSALHASDALKNGNEPPATGSSIADTSVIPYAPNSRSTDASS